MLIYAVVDQKEMYPHLDYSSVAITYRSQNGAFPKAKLIYPFPCCEEALLKTARVILQKMSAFSKRRLSLKLSPLHTVTNISLRRWPHNCTRALEVCYPSVLLVLLYFMRVHFFHT